MQIVINIPEEEYEDIKYCGTIVDESRDYIASRILNGVILPKEHGRFGDLDALEKEIEDYSEGAFAMTPEFLVKHVPTIIEADKESEEV